MSERVEEIRLACHGCIQRWGAEYGNGLPPHGGWTDHCEHAKAALAQARREAWEAAAEVAESFAGRDVPNADCEFTANLIAATIRALRRPPSPREEALEEAPPQATLEKKPEEPLTRVTVTGKKVPAPSGPPPAQVNPAPGGLQGRI